MFDDANDDDDGEKEDKDDDRIGSDRIGSDLYAFILATLCESDTHTPHLLFTFRWFVD